MISIIGSETLLGRELRESLAEHGVGRGLQLIEAHMDEVSISTSSGGGTTIHMVKYEKKES